MKTLALLLMLFSVPEAEYTGWLKCKDIKGDKAVLINEVNGVLMSYVGITYNIIEVDNIGLLTRVYSKGSMFVYKINDEGTRYLRYYSGSKFIIWINNLYKWNMQCESIKMEG